MKNCPTCQTSYPDNFMVCPQDGIPLIAAGPWSDGSVIRGKYRIVCKVGQGGMGTVYKVVHVAFQEVHALKVIMPALMSDELFVKRFKHEAVITRKLQHPNAVRVDDIDEAEDGRPIIVMEYIEGQSLKHLIQEQGALPIPRVCSIIKQAAAALGAAHELGMVHRDIKPDNIVLVESPEGELVKVLDFGIAKIKEAQNSDAGGLTLTGTGVVIGTPQYMSPEQAMGKRGDDLNGRSDLYSLGVVMYQMLTGDLPFKADTTMGMLLAHMQSDPTPIRVIHPELQIPEGIANVVMRTLEKNPDDRPQTAQALIDEINAAESDAPPLSETRVMAPMADFAPPPPAPRPREIPRTPTMSKAPARDYVSRPVPVAPPPPPVRPAPVREEPAPSPQPLAPPAPQKSSPAPWLIAAALAIVLVAGGGYFFLLQGSKPVPPVQDQPPVQQTPKPAENPAQGSAAGEQKPDANTNPGTTQPESGTEKQPSDAQPDSGKPSDSTTDANNSNTKPGRETERPPRIEKPTRHPATSSQSVPAARHVDQRAIDGAIKMGEFYMSRGEYDKAISEIQKGLALDPANSSLRSALDRARRAKASESRILN